MDWLGTLTSDCRVTMDIVQGQRRGVVGRLRCRCRRIRASLRPLEAKRHITLRQLPRLHPSCIRGGVDWHPVPVEPFVPFEPNDL